MNNSSAKMAEGNYKGTKSLCKVTEILKLLSLNKMRLSEIASKSKLSKSTVHRLLKSMVNEDLVSKDPISQEYFLGSLLFTLVSNPLETHHHVVYCSYSKMDYLCQLTGETVTLEMKSGMQKIVLQQLTGSKHPIYIGRPIGPMECICSGASGKAILSQLTENELDIILDNIELVPLTLHTITDKHQFKDEVDKVRERGYATSFGEVYADVAAIAVPIKEYVVPLSLAVVGPQARLSSKVMDYLAEMIKSGQEISQLISKNDRIN